MLFSTALVSGGMIGVAGAPATLCAGCPCCRSAPVLCCEAATGCSASTTERMVSFGCSFDTETGMMTGVVSTGCRRDSCDILPCSCGCGTAAGSAGLSATMAGRLFSWTGAFATGATLVTAGVSNGCRAGSCIVRPCADGCSIVGCPIAALSFSWVLKWRFSAAAWCGAPSNPPTWSRS